MANHASEARELSAGGDRTANAQKAETEANGVRAVESGQDRMAIRARVVGSAPVPMEIAVHAVARNVVNGAADPGFGGASFNREEFIKRIDKDGDGELNDAERDAMRDELRQQFSRGRGGERSSRSGRSSRGRGGFGGGGKPTEEYRFVLLSLDRKTGRENWRRVAATQVPHEGHHRDHGYASGSPVTDGEHIIVSFGSRGLYCYDMKGKLQWKKDFGDMRTRNSFGEGSSPALHGDTVLLLWDHEATPPSTRSTKRAAS